MKPLKQFNNVLTLDVRGVPELIADLGKELADTLREAAQDEPPTIAARLRALAAGYEAGQKG